MKNNESKAKENINQACSEKMETKTPLFPPPAQKKSLLKLTH